MTSVFRHRTAYGLEIAGYYLPGLTAAVGVIAAAGAAREEPSRPGASHVIEQAAFQATRRQPGDELRSALERSGLRAGTALNPEWIRYWIAGLAADLPDAIRHLSECILAPALDTPGVATAKLRAQGRLRRHREQREAYVTDLLRSGIYSGHPLANPALGTSDGIASLGAGEIEAFHALYHRPASMAVAVAGEFDWDQVAGLIEACFAAAPAGRPDPLPPARIAPARVSEHRDDGRQRIAIAFPGPAYQDSQFYTWAVITQILGGDQTSRLFRRVREEGAMTYAVSARLSAHSCGGEMSVCGTTAPGQSRNFVAAVSQAVRGITSGGLTSGELATAKAQLAGQLVMRGESTSARLHTLLTSLLFTGEARGIEQIGSLIDRVTPDDVRSVLARWRADATAGLATVGPYSAEEISDALEPAAHAA